MGGTAARRLKTDKAIISTLIQSKKQLAELTVASGEQWITELADSERRALVSLANDQD